MVPAPVLGDHHITGRGTTGRGTTGLRGVLAWLLFAPGIAVLLYALALPPLKRMSGRVLEHPA